MNVQTLFQNFNPSKFIVHCCNMLFTIFFSMRLDGTILWSYWVVFAPIWFWKFMAIIGASVGSYVWWRYPHFRLEGEAYIHYKAMLITLALHLILLMFELLACDNLQSSSDKLQFSSDKLQSGRHLWILVFMPLIFISVVSIAVCIWAVKHDRSFELELFCSVNMLQFIFLALKLDGFTQWSWEVVFVPLWIVMCLSLVSVLYTIIFAGILIKTPEVNPRQRRTSFNTALGYTLLVVPILVFQVLLTNKLDGDISMSFFGVSSPLLVSFSTLIIMSFNSKGGNKWWFGLRKDFCQFLLGVCPFLQEYANIAYNSQVNQRDSRVNSNQHVEFMNSSILRNSASDGNSKSKNNDNKNSSVNENGSKSVAPIVSIDMPD